MSARSDEELGKSASHLEGGDFEGDPEKVAKDNKVERSHNGDTKLAGNQCPLGVHMRRGKNLDPAELARAALPGHCQVEAGSEMFKRPIGKVNEDAAVHHQKLMFLAAPASSTRKGFFGAEMGKFEKPAKEQETLRDLLMAGRAINAAKRNKKPLELVELMEHVKEVEAEVDQGNKRWELSHLFETEPGGKKKGKRAGKKTRDGEERQRALKEEVGVHPFFCGGCIQAKKGGTLKFCVCGRMKCWTMMVDSKKHLCGAVVHLWMHGSSAK